jgi:DNA-binding ferritin-like protein
MNYQQQLKGLHWQTKSYARHKAYGKMYDTLNDFIDTFAEISMGKYGRIEFKNTSLAIYDIESPELSDYLSGVVEYLNSISDKLDETDMKILEEVVNNGRISLVELSSKSKTSIKTTFSPQRNLYSMNGVKNIKIGNSVIHK